MQLLPPAPTLNSTETRLVLAVRIGEHPVMTPMDVAAESDSDHLEAREAQSSAFPRFGLRIEARSGTAAGGRGWVGTAS